MIATLLILAAIANAERPIIETDQMSQCGHQQISVYASGFVHTCGSVTCGAEEWPVSTLRQVTPEKLATMKRTIAAARLESLPRKIEPENIVTDEDLFTIRDYSSGAEKRFSAFGLDRIRDRELARRFRAVWEAVQRLALEAGK